MFGTASDVHPDRSFPIQCTTTYHHLDTLLDDALVRVRLSSDRGIAQFLKIVLLSAYRVYNSQRIHEALKSGN